MSKTAMNLQDSFLNQVRRENTEVRMYLVNGTELRGTVKGFDNFTVILNSRNGQHLIYKHAIAQLVSRRAASLHRDGEDGATPREEGDCVQDAPTHTDESPKPRKEGFNTIDLSKVKL
jgi:host factor-I protein